ncbi:bacterioferritin [Terasakiispira papahanaumokuakeensis]|uniref:Bacterioferritin n=1 Tax=Terasakiispira papahanaumokuakeensis TaxID=197479 RepID=A0A1E2VDY4_9GAMM|nr:bacterioferritin [Terasakiispira papahanaumokuakeensis]ODC04875.1 bacterioferritin [Terasakiispira papahanaumokuakeensis]
MKGDHRVIDALNELLAMELAAMDQYFVHSRMYADWGLNQLYERINHEVEDEKGHAAVLIERILFLEGTPDMTQRTGFKVGTDVKSMLESDLQLEYTVRAGLQKTIQLCEQLQDYQTRTALMPLLEDTEIDHTHWLEQQLKLIDRVGMENYQQSKM